MLCRDGFTAQGEINLVGADIGGAPDLNDATLTNPGGVALHLEAARANALFLRPGRRTQGAVDLTNAQVTNFGDDRATWPATPRLRGLATLLTLGTAVFERAHPRHMTQADPSAPAFHALAYTLDVLLSIADLGQQKAWQPSGAAMYSSWALMAAGWILATAVVAGLTGILKRD